MRVMMMDVTPEVAERWLAKSATNRNLRTKWISALARDMTAGNFTASNDAVVFNESGEMTNGQHRAHAVVESGATVPMMVMFGMPEEAMQHVDNGKARMFGDVLKIAGEKNTALLATCCKWLWVFKVGGLAAYRSETPTHGDLSTVLDDHPGLRDSVAAISHGQRPPTGVSQMAALHYMVNLADSESNKARFERFADGVGSGAGLEKTDPAFHLRRTMLRSRMSALHRVQPEMLMVYCLKAWNAERAGRKIQRLQYRSNEGWPVPSGVDLDLL